MDNIHFSEYDKKLDEISEGISAYERAFFLGFHLAEALYEMNKTIPTFSETCFKTMRETIEEMKEQRK